MPEHLLHCPQICTAVEQVCCGSMPKRVRPRWTGSWNVGKQACYKLIDRARTDPLAAGAKKGSVRRLGEKSFSPVAKVTS